MGSEGAATDVTVTKRFAQRVQKLDLSPPPPAPTVDNVDNNNNKRRCSSRLRDIPEAKRPYYGPLSHIPHPSTQPIVNKKNNNKTSCLPNAVGSTVAATTNAAASDDTELNQPTSSSELVSSSSGGNGVYSYAPHSREDVASVKRTLRLYNKHYLHFLQEENASQNGAAKKPVSKKKGVCETSDKRNVKRPDLKAITKMKECNEVLFPTKRLGHFPGIDVGYQFHSRTEMCALGFHCHWLNGIDYMGKEYKKMKELKDCTFPLAVAIVLSGQYEDDQDNSEDIVYTGQGGNDLNGSKHQIKNQEMSRGNLALKNNKEQSIPVRVIRGHKGDTTFKTYTYDGLYKVSEWKPVKGVSGFIVYKYRLTRLDGQPKLTSNQVHYSNARSSRAPIKPPQMVCPDITEGQEDVHIPVVNTIDNASITGFTYTRYHKVMSNVKLPPCAGGCKCKGNCTNPKTCACAKRNGVDFPYIRSNGGRLMEPKDVVFECGPNCGCGPGCINRVSQRGIKYQLEIFRTSNRGWAVKTKDFIPSGAPVCEYIGELKRTKDLDSVAENDYIFEIDGWQTMKEIGGRERRLGDVSESLVADELEKVSADEKESMPEPEFCIDAGSVGNVARFINHSCEPNLFVQCVLSTHHDIKQARIVLFASDNIQPMQELTYDYGYPLDSVVDDNNNVKMLPCHCGTSECRKRLY